MGGVSRFLKGKPKRLAGRKPHPQTGENIPFSEKENPRFPEKEKHPLS